VEKVLEDRTIENTMAGAKRRIQEFYDYKTKDKNVLLGEQLGLEGLYNNLSMRLSHNKRPDFVPPSGLTLKDVSAAIAHLEECEQERRGALSLIDEKRIPSHSLFSCSPCGAQSSD